MFIMLCVCVCVCTHVCVCVCVCVLFICIVQHNWACLTWKSAKEIKSLLNIIIINRRQPVEKDGESQTLPYVPCLTLEDDDDHDDDGGGGGVGDGGDDDDDDDDDRERWRILVLALCAMFDTGG